MNIRLFTGLFYTLILSILVLVSCQEDTNPLLNGITDALSKAQSEPTKANLSSYFDTVNEFVSNRDNNKTTVQEVLQEAAQFASSQKQHASAISYYIPLLKDYSSDCKTNPDNVLSMATAMKAMRKDHAAMMIYANYSNEHPQATKDADLADLLSKMDGSPEAFIDTLFNEIFVDPDQYGLNRPKALQFVDVVEAYALSNPCSKKAPEYLYRAGEIARSIRTLPKAMSVYDWILDNYPDYEKTPTVYFLKGFMMENNVKDVEAAKEIYNDFLVKYPTHEMADDVKFLLENIGRSDEEILEFLEKKQEKN